MFDKFAEDHRIATSEIGDMSVELMSAPLRDEEKERLDRLRNELDMERQKFTDAAIRFGKEKATLEVTIEPIVVYSSKFTDLFFCRLSE